jgi:hypothetical protein
MNNPFILVLLWLQIILAVSKVDAAPPTKGPWGLDVGDQRQVFIDAGKPLRLRSFDGAQDGELVEPFVMRDADLYAFQFRKSPVRLGTAGAVLKGSR